jgi:hypothetical protein
VPKGYYAKLTLLHAANATGSNKHITFDWYDSSTTTTFSFVYQYTIASKVYLTLPTYSAIVFEENDILKVTTESASTFAVVATFEIEGDQRA